MKGIRLDRIKFRLRLNSTDYLLNNNRLAITKHTRRDIGA